jgi:hypothetical protein
MNELYGNRFAAFIDILGFKSMISQLESRSDGYERLFGRLKSVLNFMDEESVESNGQHDLVIYEQTENGFVERELGDPRMTYVSDCAIISTEATFDGFRSLCNKLTKFSTDLACDGMFVRGGITHGPLYHDRKFVFGSAYLRAYEVESKDAVVPRIVIDQSAINALREHEGQFPLNDFGAPLDGDGFRYLACFPWNHHPFYTPTWVDFLLRIKAHILFALNMHDARVADFPAELQVLDTFYCWREMLGANPNFRGGNDKILAKYVWLKDEFNRTLERYGQFLITESGKPRIAEIVFLGTHWGPKKTLGPIRCKRHLRTV